MLIIVIKNSNIISVREGVLYEKSRYDLWVIYRSVTSSEAPRPVFLIGVINGRVVMKNGLKRK